MSPTYKQCSPCSQCELLKKDKNRPECLHCPSRKNYVANQERWASEPIERTNAGRKLTPLKDIEFYNSELETLHILHEPTKPRKQKKNRWRKKYLERVQELGFDDFASFLIYYSLTHTMRQIAELIGTTPSTISRWKREFGIQYKSRKSS